LAVVVAAANVHDTKLLGATLDAIVVDRPQPTDNAPQHLCLDKGYDNPTGHQAVPDIVGADTCRTFGALAKRSLMTSKSRAIQHGAGLSSERWLGSTAVELFWYATTRRLRTTLLFSNSPVVYSGIAGSISYVF